MGWLLSPATGVRQGFRGVYAALAERHSYAGECASCKEGGDGDDACNDAPIPSFPRNCRGRSQPTTPLDALMHLHFDRLSANGIYL